jgi:hypothetical protein
VSARAFVHDPLPVRVVFGSGAARELLPGELAVGLRPVVPDDVAAVLSAAWHGAPGGTA